MDATDDRDVLLQRASADLLFELRTSLPRFLYKKPGRSGTGPKLRRHVSYAATHHLTRLVAFPVSWVII